MKYKRLCLYGGPGVGKSTLAAKLFVYLKEHRKDLKKVELVQEWIKTWAWEKRNVSGFDSLYVLAKQLRREEILLRHGVSVITDSPVKSCLAYCPEEFKAAFGIIGNEFEKWYPGFHVLLERDKSYSPEGRWQTEEEARKLDDVIYQVAQDVARGRVFRIRPNDPDSVMEIIRRWEACV